MPTYQCPECSSTEGSTIRKPDGGHYCPSCMNRIAGSQSDLEWGN